MSQWTFHSETCITMVKMWYWLVIGPLGDLDELVPMTTP